MVAIRSEPVTLSAKLKSLFWPSLAFAIALGILLSLGVWQLQRLTWKVALLAQIQSRIHLPPQPLPPFDQWAGLKPLDYDYRAVSVTGTFEHKFETLVFDGTGPVIPGLSSNGYLVLTPVKLADGSYVIVNRGFIPVEARDKSALPYSKPGGTLTITGLMRPPQTRNVFTPADNPASGQWFTRDPASIAAYYHLDKVAPFIIDEAPDAASPHQLPLGGSTEIDIPNNHMSYALTWFGLALGLIGVFVGFIIKRLRGN
ncbi:MAG: SURF1 family protein [Hyphomicrobiales bacterium]|nr:SURF1 family protein [Hyphomicrobiales bacterium]MDE2113515.1 SURF1 family protein [Hyphomicrobiales bacterium]